ncbi:MAG: glycosyltransferase [Akkermansia sp.]|nr:glycosyltransferase [Akkermansia sp.]
MHPRYKKIYSCTPTSFIAPEFFHDRDNGLISKTLRSMNIESQCILPLPWKENSSRHDIIRTEYKNLESVEWWKNLGLDAVVLYSWGAPKYNKVARAIHKAGIHLWIHLDSSCNFEGPDWNQLSLLKKIFRYLKVKAVDFFRAQHLKYADTITTAKPAAEKLSNRLFYRGWIQDKFEYMPCPVSPAFSYDGTPKQNRILCLGRWNDVYQKRPEMLMKTLELLYSKGCTATTYIFGYLTEDIQNWHKNLDSAISEKIILKGSVPNAELINEYKAAKIVFNTSLFESSHIVSAEGLCCGCSIVTPNRPDSLCDLLWYTTQQSGTISTHDTASSLADAITSELNAWETGERDPQKIAQKWQPFFHVNQIIHRIFEH